MATVKELCKLFNRGSKSNPRFTLHDGSDRINANGKEYKAEFEEYLTDDVRKAYIGNAGRIHIVV